MTQPQHPPQYPGHPYPGGPVPPAPPPRRRRRTWLKVGLVVLAGLIAFSIFGNRGPVRAPDTGDTGVTGGPSAGEVQEAGSLSVFDLQPGDCYNTREEPPLPDTSQPISVVEAVPCTTPHTDQVIAKVTYGETDSLADVLAGRADTDCTAQFEALVDPAALEDPSLLPGRLVPSNADTWSRNRVIACVIFSEDPITRSLLA